MNQAPTNKLSGGLDESSPYKNKGYTHFLLSLRTQCGNLIIKEVLDKSNSYTESSSCILQRGGLDESSPYRIMCQMLRRDPSIHITSPD